MLGIDKQKLKNRLASGHGPTWMATIITLWAIGVIALSWYLVAHENKATKYVLAGIFLYEALP